METKPLKKGDVVRVRRLGTEEFWCLGKVALASKNGQAVALSLGGVVRGATGYFSGVLPLTIDFDAQTITGFDGQQYEIEVTESVDDVTKTTDTKSMVLVCSLADTEMVAQGASFDRFCSKCQRRVCIAPSGQRALKRYPKMTIVCTHCLANMTPDINTLAERREIIEGEIKNAVPNKWRNRN